MSTKAELQALLERVKAATGPDREIDRLIGETLSAEYQPRNVYRRGHYIGNRPVLLRVARDYPRYTASLDAITALIERELPGWAWFVQKIDVAGNASSADLWIPAQRTQGLRVERCYEQAATPPLALTAAFLSAMIAQMEDEHAEA